MKLIHLLKSKVRKVKSSFNESEIKKDCRFSTHIFKRKNNEFVICDVSTSLSGVIRTRVQNIIKNLKNKWKKNSPSIRKMLRNLIKIMFWSLIFLVLAYGLSRFLYQFSSYRRVPRRMHRYDNLYASLTFVPKHFRIHEGLVTKPPLPRVAPTCGNGLGSNVNVSLVMPETSPYLDLMALQFVYQQMKKQVLPHRAGASSLSPAKVEQLGKMFQLYFQNQTAISSGGWIAIISEVLVEYVSPRLISYTFTSVATICFQNGYRGPAVLLSVLSVTGGVLGFSVGNANNQHNPGHLKNPIENTGGVPGFRFSTNRTMMAIHPNRTAVNCAIRLSQIRQKYYHFNDLIIPEGANPDEFRARFVANLTLMAENYTKVLFDGNYRTAQPALVALYKNLTDNSYTAIVYRMTQSAAKYLGANATFLPEYVKRELVQADFATLYTLSKKQLEDLVMKCLLQCQLRGD